MSPGVDWGAIGLVLASILIGVTGQLFLKRGMTSLGAVTLSARGAVGVAVRILTNRFIVTGLLAYFVSAAFWIAALTRVDLSYAYPLLASNVVLVSLGARFLLGEQVSRQSWLAILIIMAGIVMVSLS